MIAHDVVQALAAESRPNNNVVLQRFFKTGKGQYGESDEFIGVRVPKIRSICKQFSMLPLVEVQILFNSPIHEHRLAAGFILNYQYPTAKNKKAIYSLYIKNVRAGRINNWDIVDTTAPGVIGRYMWDTDSPRDILFEFAHSNVLWQKRIGLLSSFYFFSKDRVDFTTTLQLCEVLLNDPNDLIQKAVGWMLREIGKRVDHKILTDFLDMHAATMPRTVLRYAIEHLSTDKKQHYMGMRAAAAHTQRVFTIRG